MSERLVVVGNGMAGVACVEQILKHKKPFDITIFGDETHINYNRIMLSSVLAGEKDFDDIVLNGIDWYRRNNINTHLGVRIEAIDSVAKTVTAADGSVTPYDKLIFATGSSAFIPPMEGTNKSGIFVFRTYDDTRQLVELSGPGIKAVVIGGGLLGLEAARGLQVQGCDVTVVHIADTLMERQLDATGGKYLRDKMEGMGIKVLCGKFTQALLGGTHVEKVRFKDGEEIDANLVVIAAQKNAERLAIHGELIGPEATCSSDVLVYQGMKKILFNFAKNIMHASFGKPTLLVSKHVIKCCMCICPRAWQAKFNAPHFCKSRILLAHTTPGFLRSLCSKQGFIV